MSDRDDRLVECDNCGIWVDAHIYGKQIHAVGTGPRIMLCTMCNADYRLVQDRMDIYQWVRENNKEATRRRRYYQATLQMT